ncbi:MAG: translation elongation factor Ts [Patescibacteria group bacterium]|nr:translation elongation factor Ts [Patescibacteria group bacterium]
MMEKIKKLRGITGAGIVDCKSALSEAEGDIDKAVDYLRKKGAIKAAKKADRETNEGLTAIAMSDDNKKASIIKIYCETDFVARNEDFINFVKDIAERGLSESAEEYFNGKKEEMILKIGENITFGESKIIEGEYLASYIHSNKKVASVVSFNKTIDEATAKDIAMQVVAMNPSFISPDEVPESEKEKEKEIYREQLLKQGKPENIIDNILIGKINKYCEEICLLKQPFIKDDKKIVEQILKEADVDAKIVKFIKCEL